MRRRGAKACRASCVGRMDEGHRRNLNGPGRPPISGFGFVSAALRCSSTHVRSAPVLAKASPKPELDGRRPRLRYRGWFRSSARSGGALTERSERPKTRVYAALMASLARPLDESISSDGPLSSSLSCSLSRLADDELLRQVDSVVATQRQQLARLLLLLGEFEERRLHLSRGYSSLFDFCTAALRFSEGEAFRRIAAARLARRFPVVLGQVARGEIHLTGLVLLRDHLTDDNPAELLAAARHRSKRELQELPAARFPRPDVKCSVRKLPAPREELASSLPSWTPAAAVAETSARTPETSSAPGVLRTSPGALA